MSRGQTNDARKEKAMKTLKRIAAVVVYLTLWLLGDALGGLRAMDAIMGDE